MADRAKLVYTDAALAAGVTSKRWAALTKLDLDIDTIRTWDPVLPRQKRVLVPIDVQAFVVPSSDPEGTVRVAGGDHDPEPFAPLEPKPAGVHLHWALPDALLRGKQVDGATSITLPALPDRWAVVRTLLPVGSRLAHVTGWVVDASTGSVTPLSSYAGTPAAAPEGTPTYTPLDGASGGTLLWSATYAGALHRFALHDDLADLPELAVIAPQGFHGGRAVYTVAGWWSDAGEDPLAVARSRPSLQSRVRSFGWHISPESPDDDDTPIDPQLEALHASAGLARPATSTPTVHVTPYAQQVTRYTDVSPAAAAPVAQVAAHYVGARATTYHSLLHGSVLGVPIDGALGVADDRPASVTGSAVGSDLDDVTAALAAPAFGVAEDARTSAERLMAAFTSGLLARITTPDGIRDLEEHEHADGFWSFPGRPLPAAVDDRLRADDSLAYGPTAVGRKGRGALAGSTPTSPRPDKALRAAVSWKAAGPRYVSVSSASTPAAAKPAVPTGAVPVKPGSARTVKKPPPRLFRPAPPIVAVRGLAPSARHHGDGLFDPEGLRCRWPGECRPGFEGTVDPTKIVPTLGSGAAPAEVLTVVREAVTLDPYASVWLARAGAPEQSWREREARVVAEHVRLFGESMTYDGSGSAALLASVRRPPQAGRESTWAAVSTASDHVGRELAAQVSRYSTAAGTPPSPVAITAWRQPWSPLYLEWEVRVVGRGSLSGWTLDGLDLSAADPRPADDVDRVLAGRSPLSTGIARSLGDAMTGWLTAENARDAAVPSQSQLSEADELALARLRDLIAPLDLVSASLDGMREQLLGIDYVGGAIVRQRASEDSGPAEKARPTASGLPVPLFGGTVELLRLRAVDTFGRVLDVPVDQTRTTRLLEVPGRPGTIAVRPRVQHGARWLFRLVDPGYALGADPLHAPEAYVDQLAGTAAVTPVSGYLLPDHMDESLEVFDRFGTPIGELRHDSVSDAVAFEPAPGRPVPPDAGPLTGIPGEFAGHAQHVGLLAAGLVRADVGARHATAPAARSALSALLRAVDTTSWSIDTFQAIGSPTVAGLVGRPVAVVRATLRLELPDDLDEVLVTEPGGPDARRAAFAALAAERFPVRLGDLGRSDDSLLGFFVDDDYTRFHVVDRVVAALARDSGRHRGHLGLLGAVDTPSLDPIEHPYLELEDTLQVVPGQVLRLTLLMLPAGKVHLTSGILPRKSLSLADDWVTPGLRRLVPSLRVGPVLVDPAEIRMPKVAALGEDQSFLRRTGPLTWKEDPIVSATSAAMLPRMPHEAQEGWIRVSAVEPPAGDPASPGSGTGGSGAPS
ncbi:MAG: hypothetical protein AVDCRST_MAG61-1220 [uncultured Friedmanniella sp.]|uniref:Uncharacterized protein n=1 Tax=uncultured Friedmanniella sp. TaxID=335381 RepID=A0A6J4KFE4_9ACTN|nr:hypothetical protein [uncultured Friedmanniella sp.]CAA9303316.1 MAG: hypothetical protein AVDCRST_MAG61-1220 [uncultured Friedmanniella sp.]